MAKKRPRVIGTTPSCIERAENELGFVFPPSFRHWLLANNGLVLDTLHIFPVYDSRDPRKTADSIVCEYKNNWRAWLETIRSEPKKSDYLLPFGTFGTGNYYCFDYRRKRANGEAPVVVWDHETGETEDRAKDFLMFIEKFTQGDFEMD